MFFEGENIAKLDSLINALKQKEKTAFSINTYHQRAKIFKEAFDEEENKKIPRIITVSHALSSFLKNKDIVLFEEELFAGHTQPCDFTFSLPRTVEEEIECLESKTHLTCEQVNILETFKTGFEIGMFSRGASGHIISGYENVLKIGLDGILKKAIDGLKRSDDSKKEFYIALLEVCMAASEYILRYASKALEMSKTVEDKYRSKHLRRIAEACEWVSHNPPRTFFEALQLLWLTHEIITLEQPSGALSLGRIDKYLYPYYKKDLESGVITKEEAERLIQAFWIKLGALRNGFQNVTLGGLLPDGTYLANDITYMCLNASLVIKFDQPLVSLRWAPQIPKDLWNKAFEVLLSGLGFPAIFNDDVCIAAKVKRGVAYEDAVNYGIVGCVEMTVPEKEFSNTEAVRINWAKVLELMLNGGRCTITGKTIPLKNVNALGNVRSFDEFYEWFKSELEYFTEIAAKSIVLLDRNFWQEWPRPFLSSTIPGCLDKGCDIGCGGTEIRFLPINTCGIASTIDSLVVIKKAVFEENRLSLQELADILRKDYENMEVMRQEFANRYPKYGNDNEEVDSLMRDIVNFFCSKVLSFKTDYGWGFQPGFYTVYWHATLGKATGALPDGRHKGVALSNGFSPSQGRDISGPTAVIRSCTKVDHTLFGNGMVLDLKFSPSFFKDDTHRTAFKYLIETYFEMGGAEVQFNIVSRETLRKAQLKPDEYRDLIVRVSGFSAYFVDLDKVLQDEIIARTEYSDI
ncbi:MAG TPA: hypothetical protein GXX51_05865 [Firmicutes bacterium]|nr:hypothetical protein [Bacillota bacterium]